MRFFLLPALTLLIAHQNVSGAVISGAKVGLVLGSHRWFITSKDRYHMAYLTILDDKEVWIRDGEKAGLGQKVESLRAECVESSAKKALDNHLFLWSQTQASQRSWANCWKQFVKTSKKVGTSLKGNEAVQLLRFLIKPWEPTIVKLCKCGTCRATCDCSQCHDTRTLHRSAPTRTA